MQNCWLVTVVDSLWWALKREDDGVPSPWNSSTVLLPPKHARHRWSCGGQCPKVGGADGHECCPYLAAGIRVFFGVSQFCGSYRGRRRCSRVGRSAHGVSGLSGVRGGPCFFQQFLFSFFSSKKNCQHFFWLDTRGFGTWITAQQVVHIFTGFAEVVKNPSIGRNIS